jgi:hypothetical protein
MFVGFCRALVGRIYRGMTAAMINRSIARPPNGSHRRIPMSKSRTLGAAIAFAVLSTAAFATVPANAAVVYCKTPGVPQGCVVRTAPVVVAPVPRPRPVVVAPVRRSTVAVGHVGYTRVTPNGVVHAGATRVVRR